MAKGKQMTAEQQKKLKEKIKNMKPEEVREMVKKQCVFCKIVSGDINSYKIYEDEMVLSFLDIQPATGGHLVVIPKEHYSVLPQVPDKEAAHLFTVAKYLAGVVFEGVGAQGVTIMQNNGGVAGQSVPHVRVHVIPRYPEDGLDFKWKPTKIDEKQLSKLQSALTPLASKVKAELLVGNKTAAGKKSKSGSSKKRKKGNKPTWNRKP